MADDIIKISELEATDSLNDGCCLPIVSNNETKKLTYAFLKSKLQQDLDFDAVIPEFSIDVNGHLIVTFEGEAPVDVGRVKGTDGIVAEDAPSDNKQYARKNAAWVEVQSASAATWGSISGTLTDQTDLNAALTGKVAVAQGTAHAGKFLVVGSDGNVTLQTLATWQTGGSY